MVLARWVFSKERSNVPIKITVRLVNVKYLTSLKGLTFSSVEWMLMDKVNLSDRNRYVWYIRKSTLFEFLQNHFIWNLIMKVKIMLYFHWQYILWTITIWDFGFLKFWCRYQVSGVNDNEHGSIHWHPTLRIWRNEYLTKTRRLWPA